MDDLILRAAVLRCIKESRENIDWGQSEDGDAFLHYTGALYRSIASNECFPAVDAAPVVHGQWLGKRYDFKKYEYVTVPYDVTTFDNPDNLFCSICQKPALQNGCEDDVPSDYCPHCGAKMDGTDIAANGGN